MGEDDPQGDDAYVPEAGDSLPLGSWDYPLWVKLFTLATVLLFGFALVSLPRDIGLARTLHTAKEQARAGRYAEAERGFVDLLREVPDSKAARLGFAQAVFADGDARNDSAGLGALEGLSLSNTEWAEVSEHMPAQYRALFNKGN